jgi:hypothetical protein
MDDHRTSVTLNQSDLDIILQAKLSYMSFHNITRLSTKEFLVSASKSVEQAIKMQEVTK